jgi:hypothetical protein
MSKMLRAPIMREAQAAKLGEPDKLQNHNHHM